MFKILLACLVASTVVTPAYAQRYGYEERASRTGQGAMIAGSNQASTTVREAIAVCTDAGLEADIRNIRVRGRSDVENDARRRTGRRNTIVIDFNDLFTGRVPRDSRNRAEMQADVDVRCVAPGTLASRAGRNQR